MHISFKQAPVISLRLLNSTTWNSCQSLHQRGKPETRRRVFACTHGAVCAKWHTCSFWLQNPCCLHPPELQSARLASQRLWSIPGLCCPMGDLGSPVDFGPNMDDESEGLRRTLLSEEVEGQLGQLGFDWFSVWGTRFNKALISRTMTNYLNTESWQLFFFLVVDLEILKTTILDARIGIGLVLIPRLRTKHALECYSNNRASMLKYVYDV